MFITYPDVDNLSACGVALAGVPGRGGEAAGVGDEGVARMWIGYEDVDRLITYPDVDNLSACGVALAGVPGRRCEAAGAGGEGVARMWIGYEDVDR